MVRKKAVDMDAVRDAFQAGEIELVGTWEAADIIGVERPRIGRWLNRWRVWKFGDATWIKTGGKKGTPPEQGPEPVTRIPLPIGNLKAGPVWLRPDIERFAASRRSEKDAAVA